MFRIWFAARAAINNPPSFDQGTEMLATSGSQRDCESSRFMLFLMNANSDFMVSCLSSMFGAGGRLDRQHHLYQPRLQLSLGDRAILRGDATGLENVLQNQIQASWTCVCSDGASSDSTRRVSTKSCSRVASFKIISLNWGSLSAYARCDSTLK